MIRLRLVLACHDLVAPMGDAGNLLALQARARARGVDATTHRHLSHQPLPDADLVLIGGADEGGLAELAGGLRRCGLGRRVDGGAHVLAVNAGFQVLLDRFEDDGGAEHQGLGLIPGTATRGSLVERPFVGRVLVPGALPAVSGFEAHWGRVTLSADAPPLTRVLLGTGNNGTGAEGYSGERILATFVHGPVLGRNPKLADHVLDRLLGPADRPVVDATWAERGREIRTTEDLLDPSGWGGERYGRRLPVYSRLRPRFRAPA